MESTNETAVRRAGALLRQGNAAEACSVLEAALKQGDADPSALRLLVHCLTQAGDFNAALDRQLGLVPDDIAGADTRGRADALAAAQIAHLAMDYDRAVELADALVARDPSDVEAAQLLATLLLWREGPGAARRALSGISVAQAPPHLLSEMLAYFDPAPEELLTRVETLASDETVSDRERAKLLLALAQHYDRSNEPDEAWRLASIGNALEPERARHDWRAVLDAHLQIFRETAPVPGSFGPQHLYLVGTPRSGQSLLQSIFAAAPGVFSLGERGALLQHVLFPTAEIARMTPASRSTLFANLRGADDRGIARLAAEARLVVDKSPLHLAVAGSLARIHPHAAFAAVVRDPADTALSIWLRSFPPIYDYANDFNAILDHVGFAFDALAAWREEGLTIHLIDHAALITDPKHACASLFDRVGLGWRDSYLDPRNRTQPVPTFSAAQVRQPIAGAMARNASPYSDQLGAFEEKIERLRAKLVALLAHEP